MVLSLVKEGKGKPFSIGIAKAKVILDNIETIKSFVDQYGNSKMSVKAVQADKILKQLRKLGIKI